MINPKPKKRSFYSYFFAAPALILYSIFFMVPVIGSFFTAFTNWNMKDLLHPQFNGLENFRNIFGDANFMLAIKNTLIFAGITTVFKVLFGLLLALILTKKLYTRNILRSIFYMPAVLSTVVIGLIFTSFFSMGGMFDSLLNMLGQTNLPIWLGDAKTALFCVIAVEIWQWSGFTMTLFIAGLQGIPGDYYEAATVDGASSFQKFVHVTLPLLAPSFTISITTALIGGLKVFDIVYVLTNGGPGFATQVLGTYVHRSFSAGFLGKSSAMSLVLTIIVSLLAITLNKFLSSREVEA